MASMSEANEQVVLKFIEAMGSNDPETAAITLASDAVAVTKGYGKFAGARSAEASVRENLAGEDDEASRGTISAAAGLLAEVEAL